MVIFAILKKQTRSPKGVLELGVRPLLQQKKAKMPGDQKKMGASWGGKRERRCKRKSPHAGRAGRERGGGYEQDGGGWDAQALTQEQSYAM